MEKTERLEPMSSIEFAPPVAFLKEAERNAPSVDVQAGLIREAALNIPDLRYESWKRMNPEQRLQLLNTLEERAAEIALRDSKTVVARELNVPGLCKNESIILNRELLKADTREGFETAVSTLIHEGRHAYQQYNMTVSQVEKSKELVNAWRTNMELGYDNGAGKFHWGRSETELKMQVREVDADAFAFSVMEQLQDVLK